MDTLNILNTCHLSVEQVLDLLTGRECINGQIIVGQDVFILDQNMINLLNGEDNFLCQDAFQPFSVWMQSTKEEGSTVHNLEKGLGTHTNATWLASEFLNDFKVPHVLRMCGGVIVENRKLQKTREYSEMEEIDPRNVPAVMAWINSYNNKMGWEFQLEYNEESEMICHNGRSIIMYSDGTFTALYNCSTIKGENFRAMWPKIRSIIESSK